PSATTCVYTPPLHDALPIYRADGRRQLQVTVREEALPEAREICGALVTELGAERLEERAGLARLALVGSGMHGRPGVYARAFERSEEHTSELQSRENLVCRL